MHAAFIDFRKAFDNVWHCGLFHKLQNYGINGNFLNTIKSMYDKTTVAHNCHGKINCSRQNFNLQSYYQINFNGINTTLFHETNTFSRNDHFFTKQTLFHETNTLTTQTLFHGTNTFSRHKHFFTAQTLSHDTNTFSRHKHFFTAQTLFHGTNNFFTAKS